MPPARKKRMITFKEAQTKEDKLAVYRLRYEAYCLEKSYLDARNYSDGLEYDEWDDYSVYFIAVDCEQIIGTIRLILESPIGFPIENHFDIKIPISTNKVFAEVSRLVVKSRSSKPGFHITNGLYKKMLEFSLEIGISDWLAILDERLLMAYRRFGFIFKEIGSPRLCFNCLNSANVLSLNETLTNLKAVNPKLYDFLIRPSSEVLTV